MGHFPTIDRYLRLDNPIIQGFFTFPIIHFTVKQIQDQKTARELLHPDLVTYLTNSMEKYPTAMDEDRIAENTVSAVATGADTTAMVLRELVFQMTTIPRIYGVRLCCWSETGTDLITEKVMIEVKGILHKRP